MFHLYGSLARHHHVSCLCRDDGGDVRTSARMFSRLTAVATPGPVVPASPFRRRWSGRLSYIAGAYAGDYYRQDQDMEKDLASYLEGDFDAVVVESEMMAPYVRLAKPGVPWILNTQNIPSVVARRFWQTAEGAKARLRSWLSYQSALRFERRLFPRFFAVTAVSDRERDMLATRFKGIRVSVVPNGVDAALPLRPIPSAFDEHLLNFTGHFGYPPNRDAIRYFCSSVLPVILQRDSMVRLELIGKGSVDFAASLSSALPVSALGYVDDVPSSLARASAVVVPLRVGGGTRIKILEAIALGKPVVATSVGAEGLDLDATCGLLIADNARDFADLTLKALQDTRLRERASTNGRARIARDYTWESAVHRLERVLQDAVHALDNPEGTR